MNQHIFKWHYPLIDILDIGNQFYIFTRFLITSTMSRHFGITSNFTYRISSLLIYWYDISYVVFMIWSRYHYSEINQVTTKEIVTWLQSSLSLQWLFEFDRGVHNIIHCMCCICYIYVQHSLWSMIHDQFYERLKLRNAIMNLIHGTVLPCRIRL